MKRSNTLLPVIAFLAGTCASNAALLIYENYNYTALADGTTLNGVATSAVGLSANYATGGTNGTAVYQSTGLTFGSNLPVSAGAVRLSANGGASNSAILGASIGVVAQSGTLWSSYLVNITSKSPQGNATGQARITDLQTGSSNNRLISLADNFGGLGTGLQYHTATTTPASPPTNANGTTLVADTTYLLLSTYTNIGIAGGGTATLWTFNQAGYDLWVGAGSVEGDLGAFSLSTQSNTSTAQADFASGSFFQVAISNATGTPAAVQTAVYDEIRWGTTLADVVPEPSTAISLGCGLALLVLRRRRL